LVSLRARPSLYIFEQNAWVLTPVAGKRSDGSLYKMRQTQERF
jgi:hypothetical protein